MSGEKRKLDVKSLKEKYEALKDLQKGLSNKDVAVKYGIPRNTVSTWLKNKEMIVSAFESGKNPKRLKLKTAENDNLDKCIYKWFLSAREQNVPVNGIILKEKAVFFAKELDIKDFQASNGWLERWKTRNNISYKTVAGEAKSCAPIMTTSWNETLLPTILSKYKLEDIYNADEFGLFYQPLPEKDPSSQI